MAMKHEQWRYREYVFTPCKNVLNDKISYWMSKENHTVALYYGTPWDESSLKDMKSKSSMDAFIQYYEDFLSRAYKK